MKIIITDYKDHSEVSIRNAEGINLYTYVFDSRQSARAFVQGFTCARTVANCAIQSLPIGYDVKRG